MSEQGARLQVYGSVHRVSSCEWLALARGLGLGVSECVPGPRHEKRTMRDEIEIHNAFLTGDLSALRNGLGDPAGFPNVPLPLGLGVHCLQYAIAHSPAALVRALLEEGADPNYADPAGFPSLLEALATDRPDRHEIVELLLDHGADVQQRGINGYSPLHQAAARDDVRAIEILLARGADPAARTDVDDHATALEEAELLGRAAEVEALRRGPGG